MQLVPDAPLRMNCSGRGEIARGSEVARFRARLLAFDLAYPVNADDHRIFRPVTRRHTRRRQHRTALGHDAAKPLFRLFDMHYLILAVEEGILNRLAQAGLIPIR